MFSGKITLAFCFAVVVIATASPQGRGPQNNGAWQNGGGPGNGRGNDNGGKDNGGKDNGGKDKEKTKKVPAWAKGDKDMEEQEFDEEDYTIPYDPKTELCVQSGPRGCPTIHVPIHFDIWSTQGDWYLYATDNDNNEAGCIGCNTVQISYWQQMGKVPQFILNACCLISCKDPRMMGYGGIKSGGVVCGNSIGTGFIWPAQEKPDWGIIKYENLGKTYTLFVIGFEDREFLILISCITYKEHGKTKTYFILRVYTRSPNPSPFVLNKIKKAINRYEDYGIKLSDFKIIPQGPGNSCRYVN